MLIMNISYATELRIAAASNISYVMDALKDAYKKQEPETEVRVTIGSSGKLAAQIKNGAPFGLFMSANMEYPNKLFESKSALSKPRVYAKGKLLLLSMKERDFTQNIEAILQQNTLHKIAIANPKTAPYGKAAKEALLSLGLYSKLKSKFVYGESISQTLFFTLHAADIGIVAASALFTPKMQHLHNKKHTLMLPTKLYTPIEQGVVLLKYAQTQEAAYRRFYNFLFSAKAKEIFRVYGYETE